MVPYCETTQGGVPGKLLAAGGYRGLRGSRAQEPGAGEAIREPRGGYREAACVLGSANKSTSETEGKTSFLLDISNDWPGLTSCQLAKSIVKGSILIFAEQEMVGLELRDNKLLAGTIHPFGFSAFTRV